MVIIKNTVVSGLDASIIKSAYPMMVGEPPDIDQWSLSDLSENDIKRAINLGNVKSGRGDDCFLKGIKVDFDIKYSLYFTKQLQRYHFIDFVSSQSTMHCITKMDIDKSCNPYVDERVINVVNEYLHLYNNFDEEVKRLDDLAFESGADSFFDIFGMKRDRSKIVFINDDGSAQHLTKYDLFMKIISNVPSGFEYWAGMTTNYLQLKSIYHQRKNHKLKEDWGYFCNWIEELPMFKELVLSKERNNDTKNV